MMGSRNSRTGMSKENNEVVGVVGKQWRRRGIKLEEEGGRR